MVAGVLGVVPREDVANSLELELRPVRLIEHGGVLLGEAHSDLGLCRGDRHEGGQEHGDGEDESVSHRATKPSRPPGSCGAIALRTLRCRNDEARGAARRPAGPAGRLPVPRRARPRHLRGQGEVDPQARGVALLGPRAADASSSSRSSTSSSRPRPRRCWRSRTSSASTSRASTSACATTSRIRTSRSRSTRTTRGSTSPASATARSAPTSAPTRRPSACAGRSTCSARSSCSAPARARSRGGARARPASTTTSSAAGRPASATCPRRSTAPASTA